MSKLPARWGEDPRVAQLLFAATFLIGIGGVAILKGAYVPQVFITAWPIAWMTFYALLVFVPPFRLRADQTADNVYYLGFLFTLVSLGFALYQFSLASGLDQVVRNFGIAIASTIAGVFGRVLLSQMRTDPFETERAVRLALSDTARALRGELDNALIEFATFRRQMQQTTADGLRELGELAAREVKTAADTFGAAVSHTTGRIGDVVDAWADGSERYTQDSVRLTASMASLSAGLQAVRPPADILEEKLAPAAEALAQLGHSAGALLADLRETGAQVRAQSEQMSATVAEAGTIVSAARENSDALGQAADLTRASAGQADRISASVEQSARALDQVAERIGVRLDRFVEDLAETARRVELDALAREQAADESHQQRLAEIGRRLSIAWPDAAN